MAERRHGYLKTSEGIHVPYQWMFADETARFAATNLLSGDVGKLALQEDTQRLYILVNTTPSWQLVGGGAIGDLDDVDLNIPAEDGDILAYNSEYSIWQPQAAGELTEHSHDIDDVTGLQTALDGKAASSHGHVIDDVTGLQTALDGKAASSHGHAIDDVTGLQTALDGKAASSHGHAIDDVTGLQTALDGKAAVDSYNVFTGPQYIIYTPLPELHILDDRSATSAEASLYLGNAASGNPDEYWQIAFYERDLRYYNVVDGSEYGEQMRLKRSGHLLLGTTTDSAQLAVKTSATDVVGLYVDTPASPTANLAEFRNNGTAYCTISPYGQVIGGFGARTTAGTLDWNDATNARSGNGHTILSSSTASNAPPEAGNAFFHPFSFEYSSKDGSGNMTQLAIPYRTDLDKDMWMRSRFGGTWTSWRRFIVAQTNSHVLIGTTTDDAQLMVKTDVVGTRGIVLDTPSTPTANLLELRTNGAARLWVDNLGSLSIKNATPSVLIQNSSATASAAEAWLMVGESSSGGALQEHWKAGFYQRDFPLVYVDASAVELEVGRFTYQGLFIVPGTIRNTKEATGGIQLVTATDAAISFMMQGTGDSCEMVWVPSSNRWILRADPANTSTGGGDEIIVADADDHHVMINTTTDPGAQLTVKANAAGDIGLVVDTASSPTAPVFNLRRNGTERWGLRLDSTNYLEERVIYLSVASGAVVDLLYTLGVVEIFDASSSTYGEILIRGAANAVVEMSDPAAGFSTTFDTSNQINVYYSSGYKLQNKYGFSPESGHSDPQTDR